MFTDAEIAEWNDLAQKAKRHWFVATDEEISDEKESGEPNEFGDYETTTATVFDGPAHVVDEEMMIERTPSGEHYDADAYVRVLDWPASAPIEGLRATATFASIARPCRVVGVERSDFDDFVYIEFTGAGVTA